MADRRDDKRARFEAQVLPHLDSAYRFARWLAPAPGEADDLVQDAVLRAYRGFEGLRGANVKAWLLTIVKNCHFTAQRARHDRLWVPLPEESDSPHEPALVARGDPEQEVLATDRMHALERVLALLPEEQRDVLILREVEDLDYRAIAEVLAVPLGTVMSRLSRARAALRARFLEREATS
jgi:RNA polymerase sigma-70 factor (ECF subfamily)